MAGFYDTISRVLYPIQIGLEYIIRFLFENVHVTNYGLIIILLTIIVRLILTPLTLSQTRSMAKMQKLQPKIQEIQKKYKGDQQKIQAETMEFYRKYKVNPFASCLPLIFQLPIFFALFAVLRDPSPIVTNLVGGDPTFLWLHLNEPDPYFILPILMVVTMFFSMKVSSTQQQGQKWMTWLMPLVFGFISYRLASGILVYWVTTNLWSMGQQWLVNRFIRRKDEKAEALEEAKEEEKKVEKEELTQEERRKIRKKKKKKRKN